MSHPSAIPRSARGRGASRHALVVLPVMDHGAPARLLETAAALDAAWLAGVQRVGVTAGASTPEHLVQGVLVRLQELGATAVRELPGLAETTRFRLPEILRAAS